MTNRLRIDAVRGRLHFDSPRLPESIQQVDIKGLNLVSGTIDVSLTRHEESVAVQVRRKTGNFEVVLTQ